jgi:hypothetical protein
MSNAHVSSDDTGIPEDWDQLDETETAERQDEPVSEVPAAASTVTPLLLLGSAWGDLVTVLAVCTASLIALALLGYPTALAAAPWGIGLGVAWWAAAAAVTVVVRNGTPGMLMAGVVFERPVARNRAPWVVLAGWSPGARWVCPPCSARTEHRSPGWPARTS